MDDLRAPVRIMWLHTVVSDTHFKHYKPSGMPPPSPDARPPRLLDSRL